MTEYADEPRPGLAPFDGSSPPAPRAARPGETVTKDGREWPLAGSDEAAWLPRRPDHAQSFIGTRLPLAFEAYATFEPVEWSAWPAHEHALVSRLRSSTDDQPWWLGFLDTGAHDVVFPDAPRVPLYWDWGYVLVEAGPDQALAWRRGHMRSGAGVLPDLFYPRDRSWLVSALWDDTWTCVGGSAQLIAELVADPVVDAHQVDPRATEVPGWLTPD